MLKRDKDQALILPLRLPSVLSASLRTSHPRTDPFQYLVMMCDDDNAVGRLFDVHDTQILHRLTMQVLIAPLEHPFDVSGPHRGINAWVDRSLDR